ncbi:hypothetical protein FHL15_005243 [Xylaria flabelliformis]|uniref:Uncharacterized protein n=1 Tax=Xylaria flabelliformis TaxID=2512241 RepID=A0A553I107_9PEZI|nr:hypothetical protein FHL15_005243 [Xylaria flabelliformis]
MCYEEARYAFWEEVIVYGYEGFPRTTIYELSQNLGEFAKSRIRHLRRLCAGLDCNRNDTTEIKTGLDQFPRLKTCEFFGSPFVYGGPLSELSKSDDEQTWINFATSRQFSDGNPHKTLKDDWKIDVKQYNIVFLMRFTVIYINAFMPYMTQAKRIWVNMTTKKYFIKRPSGVSIHMDDEEGFRCVLAESPQRRTSNKVQGEDDGYANVE